MEATTEGRYFSSRSRPFQLGMTMLAAVVDGVLSAAGLLRDYDRDQVREPRGPEHPVTEGEAQQGEWQTFEKPPQACEESAHLRGRYILRAGTGAGLLVAQANHAADATAYGFHLSIHLRSQPNRPPELHPAGLANHFDLGLHLAKLLVQLLGPLCAFHDGRLCLDPTTAASLRVGRFGSPGPR